MPKTEVIVLMNIGKEIKKSIRERTKEITRETIEVIVPKRDLKNSINQLI